MSLFNKWKIYDNQGRNALYLFSQNNGNLFEFFIGKHIEIKQKLKKKCRNIY